MNNKEKIAILIPAQNEDKVIQKTICSVLRIVPKEHVYVVNDGSQDYTDTHARLLVDNVLTLHRDFGKAIATNTARFIYNLSNRYDYIMPIDADTVITPGFLAHALPLLENDHDKKIACVVGKVTGRHSSWVTAYRIWEYEIAQSVHKAAQSIEGAVMICPGCATIYRSDVFAHINVPSGTLTEDMDLTFLIHRKKLGKIVYIGFAKVITQDPGTFSDYLKQLTRWYTGFWQCLIKHNIPWGGQMIDFEVGLIALEGLFNGILVVGFIFLVPLVLKTRPIILAVPAGVDFFLFMLPTMIYTGIKNRIYSFILYIPHFYLLRILSSFIFLFCFVKVVLSHDVRMTWHKVVRY